MKLIFTFVVIFLLYIVPLRSQDSTNLFKSSGSKASCLVSGTIIDGDTVLHVALRQITVLPPFEFRDNNQRERYSRLVRYVKKVYPYAILIQNKYAEIHNALDSIPSEKEQKKYIKNKDRTTGLNPVCRNKKGFCR